MGTSSNAGSQNFDLQQKAALKVIDTLPVTDPRNVGVITYGRYTQSYPIPINKHTEIKALKTDINRLSSIGDGTGLSWALQTVINNLKFARQQGVGQLLVIMLEEDPEGGDPKPYLQELEKSGVKIIVLGFGYLYDKETINSLGQETGHITAQIDWPKVIERVLAPLTGMLFRCL